MIVRKYCALVKALSSSCGRVLFKQQRWSSTTSNNLSSIVLRNYQEDCIQAVLAHHTQGHRRLGISLATGSGKTVIFTQLIERVKPIRPNADQTLIIVHRRELVDQAARHCISRYPDKTVDIEMGAKHASGTADITVASVQSIISSGRIAKFDPAKFKLILIDEAHHAVAKSYRQTLEYFGAMKEDADVYVVGVSATFSRADGLGLGAVMDHIVYHRDFVNMIDEGWLSKVIFTTVKTNVKLDDVRLTGSSGDFNMADLARAVNTNETNDIAVRSWIEKAGMRKSTLVFCVDIAHVIDMTNTFRKHGYTAHYVTSETPLKDRKILLDDFKDGKYPVLVNCGVFTEGTDIPNIDCILLDRPTRSRNLLIQMIGRGMRLFDGKEDCHVIDLVGSVSKGIVTTPTLFGLDPEEVFSKATAEDVKAKLEAKKKFKEAEEERENVAEKEDPNIMARPWSVTFVDYDSIHDLISDSRPETAIRRISLNAWVWIGPGRYHLTTLFGSYITVEAKSKGGYTIIERIALPPETRERYGSFYMKPRKVADNIETLEAAISAADTYVRSRYPSKMMQWKAAWRAGPPSQAQVEFLARRTKKKPEELIETGLTKGQAMDMTTRLKHGASKVLADLKVMKRKEDRLTKQNTPILDNVRVGKVPLAPP